MLTKKRGYIPKKKARPTDVVEWAIKRHSENRSEGRCPIGFPEKMPDRIPRKGTEKMLSPNYGNKSLMLSLPSSARLHKAFNSLMVPCTD